MSGAATCEGGTPPRALSADGPSGPRPPPDRGPGRPASAHDLLRRSLGVYGLGGLVLPFLGIKVIDLLVSTVPGLG
ncbi:hypothetical protein ACFRJ7_28805 [Streptomyces sp. NPDC056747]|uniref:hypothetical protein n=1 Tax=Streptomyces sp. NPDC056747 TaxID=3345935 RepID=UPI00369ACA57